jgi:hypothetical protein
MFSIFPHLTQVGFFGEMHVFLHLSLISLLGTKRAYVHLEKPKLKEAFFAKSTSILTLKESVRCSCF